MKRFILFNILIVLTFFTNSCTECREGFQQQLVTIPRANWFPLAEAVLNTASIRLNNFTPNKNQFDGRTEFAFFRRGNSQLTIAGMTQPITVLDNESLIRHDPYTVYINDINSSSVSTSTFRSELVLQMQMESEGTEIITDCINNFICFEKPTSEIDNAVITYRLVPNVDNTGRLTFEGTAEFAANTRISLCNDNFFAFLCDLFGINEGVVNQQLEDHLTDFINRPDVQNRISNSIMPLISSVLGPGERLTSLVISNSGDLIITKAVPCS